MSTPTDVRSSTTVPSEPTGAEHPMAPAAHPAQWFDAAVARLLAPRLDARLARGVDPGSGRLLAARAAQLVGPGERAALAEAWGALLARAARSPRPIDVRVPVARDDVRAAADEIIDLVAALRSADPVRARDVARARALLTSGRGPVYRSGRGLSAAVADLVAALDAPA